jgi:hypothetical protein
MKKLAIVLMVLAVAASAYAQRQNFGGGGFGGIQNGGCLIQGTRRSWQEDNTAAPRDIDRSGFVYGRLRYNVQPNWRRSGDIPWHHDYPDGDTMLPDAVERLTEIHTTPDSYQIVDIDGKELFKYPFVYLAEPGYLDIQPDDAKNLKEYLDRGGFVFVDDFRGRPGRMEEMQNFIFQLEKLYPERRLKPLDKSHPIFHSFFDVDPHTMVPPYTMDNSGDAQYFGLFDEKDRIQVMVHFNNDASEYWQGLDVKACSLQQSSSAVQLGINYVVYAMTH